MTAKKSQKASTTLPVASLEYQHPLERWFAHSSVRFVLDDRIFFAHSNTGVAVQAPFRPENELLREPLAFRIVTP